MHARHTSPSPGVATQTRVLQKQSLKSVLLYQKKKLLWQYPSVYPELNSMQSYYFHGCLQQFHNTTLSLREFKAVSLVNNPSLRFKKKVQ